jgi:hypothetical protein
MGQSWAQIRYNSPERAEKLLKERRQYEREMRGTFEQQTAADIAKANLQMATEIQRQKLANAGQLAATRENASKRLTGTKYSSDAQERSSQYGWDVRRPYYNAEADKLNAETSKLGAEESTIRLKNLFVPDIMQQLVDANKSGTALTSNMIEDALNGNTTVPKRRRKVATPRY